MNDSPRQNDPRRSGAARRNSSSRRPQDARRRRNSRAKKETTRPGTLYTSNRRRGGSRHPLAIMLVIGLVALIALLALLGRDSARREGEATIRIEPGTSTAQIARLLKDEDVIDSERDFLKKAEQAGVGGELKSGVYRFTRGEPVEGILVKMQQGLQAPEGVFTVPEGYSLSDIAVELASRSQITEKQYVRAAVPAGRTLPFPVSSTTTNLEGFLFPSTYDMDPGVNAEVLVDRQLEAFRKQTAGLPWEKAAPLNLTEYEILTVASLIEREARVPEERAQVAAVIYNRMRAGMKLEIDATVQYAVGSWKRELTQEDLETDSPYNTRLYEGLPPGPICNPGVASILAALEPADVDYLFYVATGDEEGHHFFTASYDEFLAAQQGD